MPRLYHRSQLALHIKRAICAHHQANPLLRHVDLARWCFTRFGVRPDRSTIGRVLKGADRWDVPDDAVDAIRVRGGAYPALERSMARWISNAGPVGVPLTLATIRDHVATMARANGVPPTFRCSIGWVRRALRRQGVRCMSAVGEAADQDLNAVRTTKEKLPQLLMHLGVRPRDTFNFDETALYISVLPRKTYGTGRSAGRKVSKDRLTVGFLVNADGTHAFRPLVISKAKRPHDFRPDFDPEEYCYWRNTAKGWMTKAGMIAMTKARYRQHWLRAFTGMWTADGATSAAARFKLNLRRVLEWLHDAWMNIPHVTIQRCWWRTECLPRAWAMELPHVEQSGDSQVQAGGDIGLDEELNDVGVLIDRLGLGPSALPASEFVGIDDNQPTCAEPGEDPLAREPASAQTTNMWEAPAATQAVYDDNNPATREARRTARAACEMLIGYARATCITPRDLCALFDIRNPMIIARMERKSPALNLNATPPPAPTHEDTPPAETPRRRGRLLPAWMAVPTPDWVAQSARRQELIDAGAPAVMSGYLAAAEWMRL
ncbi:unnamed protein product [Closterium sp. NIES-64]|nr:unnamed protein product [Closterium sp. NIES-64]